MVSSMHIISLVIRKGGHGTLALKLDLGRLDGWSMLSNPVFILPLIIQGQFRVGHVGSD